MLVVALTAMTALAACSPPDAEGGASAPPSVAAPSETPRPTAAVDVPVTAATPPPVKEGSAAPERLVVPDLQVDMPVAPVGVQDDGSMEIPTDPAVGGWYRYGSAPGDDDGTTVIAAHVDSRVYGIGPLARLREAQPGQTVQVTDAAGATSSYTVESVTYIPRAALPVDELFDRDGARSLVLITCGGDFDEQTRTYSDNVVLVARASP
ncbi:sortase [Microbacterium sp. zg.Y1090]|uniref:class F sortase n=1 Tax=Microbacterium wangruii TaxID=3049073 RepID=UPI00214D21DB|nr:MULTISPECIES: class F sortase [unclassified Microbacterium]MCR2819052.1 sortase [Microbacterium sp. zg.Y1090]MDL5487702.1 sortase [Microbacterium sp. zg-Y1211]WIM27356.1 sortase [Microbacterium sp. zg-Y1090]